MNDTTPTDNVLLDPDAQLELDALGIIIQQLSTLDEAAQHRVVAYCRSRFGDPR